jgi:hypothetical protein
MKACLPVVNIFLENVAGFKYLAKGVTSFTYIHEEFKN